MLPGLGGGDDDDDYNDGFPGVSDEQQLGLLLLLLRESVITARHPSRQLPAADERSQGPQGSLSYSDKASGRSPSCGTPRRTSRSRAGTPARMDFLPWPEVRDRIINSPFGLRGAARPPAARGPLGLGKSAYDLSDAS